MGKVAETATRVEEEQFRLSRQAQTEWQKNEATMKRTYSHICPESTGSCIRVAILLGDM